MKYLLFTLSLLFLSPQANAQAFDQYLTHNKIYKSAIDTKFNNVFLQTYPTCKETVKIQRLKPETIATPYFSFSDKESFAELNKKNPDYGLWIEKSIARACGKQVRLNILVIGYDEAGLPLMYPSLNGRTHIKAINQTKAEHAVNNALKQSNECQTIAAVIDTQFVGYKSIKTKSMVPNNENSGWFEQWTVEACNTEKTINLAVIPDPRTQYRYIAQVKE